MTFVQELYLCRCSQNIYEFLGSPLSIIYFNLLGVYLLLMRYDTVYSMELGDAFFILFAGLGNKIWLAILVVRCIL